MNFLHFLKLVFNTIAPDSNYSSNWHIRAISDRLEAAYLGKINRLIINVPPRSMKSICVSVAWPAWLIGLNPKSQIIAASYSKVLSEKLSLDTRYILQSPWYKEIFPAVTISKEQNTKSKFQTTQLGYRFATSVGGTITGEGGTFLIVDDPMNPLQAMSPTYRRKVCDWFSQSLLTRLNDRKKGVVVLVMHRLHSEDLTGYLLSKEDSKKWHHLSMPLVSIKRSRIYSLSNVKKDGRKKLIYKRKADEPIRKRSMGRRYIDTLKREVGMYTYAAQYQQAPLDGRFNKGIIQRHWFKRYDDAYNLHDLHIVQSWDTANTAKKGSNYSVCTTWAIVNRNFLLLDVCRVKEEYQELKQLVLQLQSTWKAATILVEEKASGYQLIQELREFLPIIPITPCESKLTRTYRSVSIIQGGYVSLPKRAVWLDDFEEEVCTFPESETDDQLDSMTQALYWTANSNISKVLDSIQIREL